MWNYTSTNVINGSTYVDGTTPAWKVNATPGDTEDSFVVTGGPKFTANSMTSVTKAVGYGSRNFSLTVDLSNCDDSDTIYRLFLYIRSVGNNDPLYSNNNVFKGRPFFVEFKGGTSGLAAKVKKNAKKYANSVYGEEFLKFTVDAEDDNVLIIEGVNEYQSLHEALLQYFDDSCAACNAGYPNDQFVTEASSDPKSDLYDEDVFTEYVPNLESFGTYNRIMKDLRLPSAENVWFYRPMKDEMPVPGVIYNEFIVTQCSPRPEVRGSAVAIGTPVTSLTKHVFFVAQSISDTFESDLDSVFPGTITIAKTQVDQDADGEPDDEATE